MLIDVVDGTGIKTLANIVAGITGGNKDNRNGTETSVLLETDAGCVTISLRHHHIHQDEVIDTVELKVYS